MECGYYDSFVFGWYCVGILTGAFACSRTVTKYVTVYRPMAEAESDNESENGVPTLTPVSTDEFQVGDKVRVVLSDGQKEPSFGWGGVSPDDIGYISSSAPEYVKDKLCYRVDFPTQNYWLALASELRRVSF